MHLLVENKHNERSLPGDLMNSGNYIFDDDDGILYLLPKLLELILPSHLPQIC